MKFIPILIIVIVIVVMGIVFGMQIPAQKESVENIESKVNETAANLGQEVDTLEQQLKDLESQLTETQETLQQTQKTISETNYKDDALGMSFTYPKDWGDVTVQEIKPADLGKEAGVENPAGISRNYQFSTHKNIRIEAASADLNEYAMSAYKGDKDIEKECVIGEVARVGNDTVYCVGNPTEIDQLLYTIESTRLPENGNVNFIQSVKVNLHDDIFTGLRIINMFPEADALINAPEDVNEKYSQGESYVMSVKNQTADQNILDDIKEFELMLSTLSLN